MRTLDYPPGVTGPRPYHTLTPAAEYAREAMRRAGARRRGETLAEHAELVTRHPQPYLGDVETAGARRLVALAESAGLVVNTIATLDAYVVEGIDEARGVGFRATWERGRAKWGTWHERVERYELVDDPRPAYDDAKPGAKRRPRGLGKRHLKIVASPRGVSVGVTAVIARVKALSE